MASTYLTAGTMGSVTNRKKFTISFWIKRGSLGEEYMWQSYNASSLTSYRLQIDFQSDDKFEIRGVDGNTMHTRLVTNREFKDTNAWYHIYCSFDSTQGTASDRVKIYVNGEQQTSLATSTYPNQNVDFAVGVDGSINYTLDIGRWGGGSNYWSGSMSHFYYVDGSVIAHTQFGSTDTTTGEWKINTNPTIASYGNEGFLVLKDGNTVTDQSPNSNNLTVGGGTLTKTEDNPSNVFATLNPLDSDLTSNPFQYGNTKVSGQNPESAKYYCSLTLGMMGNGKYYFEAQLNVNNQGILGVCNLDASDNPTYLRQQNTFPGRYSSSWGYDLTDGYKFNNNNKTDYGGGTSWSANDYISFALDNTNGKMYIAKNGSWVSGGNPTNGTGGIDYSAIGDNNMFIVADNNGSGYNKFTFNFGNGSFDTTTLSTTYSPTVGDTSAKFKYNIIPTGYTALSTKGLNL